MSEATLPEGLKTIIADVLDIPLEEITPQLAVGDTDSWDSFGHLQVILALENEFGVQFDPARIPELSSLQLIRAELEAKGVALEE